MATLPSIASVHCEHYSKHWLHSDLVVSMREMGLHNPEIRVLEDHIARTLVYRLRAWMWAEERPDYVERPKTWWDAVKLRWCPWLGVDYERIPVVVLRPDITTEVEGPHLAVARYRNEPQ